MLQLFFEGMSSRESFRTEPTDSFFIDGESITDSSGQTIAVRKDGFWKADEKTYLRIVCDGPLDLLFARTGDATAVASDTYEHVTIFSSMILSGNKYLALLDKDADWLDYRTRKSWSVVVLSGV